MPELKSEYMIASDVSEPTMATHRWNILSYSSGALLGRVGWYGAWRQYTFSPSGATIFNSSCLSALQVFLDEANAEHKNRVKK